MYLTETRSTGGRSVSFTSSLVMLWTCKQAQSDLWVYWGSPWKQWASCACDLQLIKSSLHVRTSTREAASFQSHSLCLHFCCVFHALRCFSWPDVKYWPSNLTLLDVVASKRLLDYLQSKAGSSTSLTFLWCTCINANWLVDALKSSREE